MKEDMTMLLCIENILIKQSIRIKNYMDSLESKGKITKIYLKILGKQI